MMRKMSKVIKEAHNRERKRRQTARKEKRDEIKTRTQQAKSLIANIKRGGMRREEIVERLERIFGKGSGQEIETIHSNENIVERIEELSKREEQYEKWEMMRRDAKRRQRTDKRLNAIWRWNKTFAIQFGGDEKIHDAGKTLAFWRSVNNKEVSK